MRITIKLLITFVVIFIMFYPLSIAVDTVFTQVESASTSYTRGNITEDVGNFTSLYSTVFQIVYSISAIGIVATLIVDVFVRRQENEYY